MATRQNDGADDATRRYYDEFAAAYEVHRRPNSPDGYHALVDDLEIELTARYGTFLRASLPPMWQTDDPAVVRKALARLAGQSVPIVLAEASRYQSEFVFTYPLLAHYISEHYREAGTIDGRFLVFVDASRTPKRDDPYSGLPCFL